MSTRNLSISQALIAVSLAIGSSMACAQEPEADLLRRTQIQLRQSEQERNSLRSEVGRLQAQLDSLQPEMDRLRQQLQQGQGKQAAAAAELAARSGKLGETSKALSDARQELVELRAQSARQAKIAQNAQGVLVQAKKTIALRDEILDLCRNRNQELYNIGTELVTMYRNPDFNSLRKREPVLQIQQVKMQNMTQDFEDRLRKQRIYEDTLPPSVEQAMQQDMAKGAADAAAP